MTRQYGSRERQGSAQSVLLSSDSSQRHEARASVELSVLRTTLRRLGLVGLQVFDVWAETASADELEWANDNVKPLLDELSHLPTK